MKTKTIAGTRAPVSVVGLGTAFVGRRPEDRGKVAGAFPIDTDLAVETISAGIAGGVTLIDSAPYYNTESVVGEALRGSGVDRDAVTIMTKAGRYDVESFDFSADAVRAGFERSLEALGLDRIDVVSIHDAVGVDPAFVMSPKGAFGALSRLRDEGLIDAIGTACYDPSVNAAYLETGEFQVAICSSSYSLLNHHLFERILPAARAHGASLIAAEPLERGLLAVGVQPGAQYANRSFSPAVLEAVGGIQALCAARGVSLLDVALQWLTRTDAVASAIPGPANAAEARSNAAAGAADIPESFWAELDGLLVGWPLADLGIRL